MATALAATYQAGTTTDPPRVLLQVTGAPSQTPPYSSNFATTDSWTIASPGTRTATTYLGRAALRLQTTYNTRALAQRTVTGLTISQTYRFAIEKVGIAGRIVIGVQGLTSSSPLSAVGGAFGPLGITFTATATSHVITLEVIGDGGTPATPDWYIGPASVYRTSGWLGTTIVRTDANGTATVRAPVALDTVGTSGSATMTVTDYEAALYGSLSYTVTDGNGATDTETVTAPTAPGVWLTLPATSDQVTPVPPSFVAVQMVTTLTETNETNGSLHTIIGRADPIANPGPLARRSGTIDIFCADYAAATAVRNLFANGDVAHLRQPSYPAMDAYLVARDIQVSPEESTGTQRWIATVTYQEVAAP